MTVNWVGDSFGVQLTNYLKFTRFTVLSLMQCQVDAGANVLNNMGGLIMCTCIPCMQVEKRRGGR